MTGPPLPAPEPRCRTLEGVTRSARWAATPRREMRARGPPPWNAARRQAAGRHASRGAVHASQEYNARPAPLRAWPQGPGPRTTGAPTRQTRTRARQGLARGSTLAAGGQGGAMTTTGGTASEPGSAGAARAFP
ncbi:MAG: hypothetical protein OXU61_04620, partial [Gammaproteobacteria bacterium]|nr:hypothetical protein [Gammaproteobacteria bacterium]